MIAEVAELLDGWVLAQNLEARADGLPALRPCRIRVLGQTALFELKAPLHLNLTQDVDVVADYEYPIQVEFRRLLAARGKELDPLGAEVWMPRETRYSTLFAGQFVTVQVAGMEYVLLSKALKAPQKNHALIVEYLAGGASELFLTLAGRYGLDLESFL